MEYIFEQNFSNLKIKNINKQTPVVSIFFIGYNKSLDKIKNSLLTISNQSFEQLEIIVIYNKSNNLKEFIKDDKRIKVVAKDLTTVSELLKNSHAKTDFYTILEAGEYIEKTYIETNIISLQLNENEKISYTDSVNYKLKKKYNYIFENKILKDKTIPVPNLVFKKETLATLKNIKLEHLKTWEKTIDIIKLYSAIHQSYYGFKTYKDKSDLNEENYIYLERIIFSLDIISYPMDNYYYEIVKSKKDKLKIYKRENKKTNILFFIPWMVVGGADKFNLDFIRLIDKEKYTVTVVSDLPTPYVWRQKFDEFADSVFDISTFVDRRDWPTFMEYIIESRNINLLLVSNSITGYNLIPYIKLKYPHIPVIDYIHSVEIYNRFGGYGRDSYMINSLIDKTLFCSKNAMESYNNLFNNKKNCGVVYIGVDSDKFKPNKELKKSIREEHNLNDTLNIGFLCRIDSPKRPLLLAEIAREYINKNKKVKFIVGGEGPLLNQLIQQIKNYEIEQYFIFLGNMENTIDFYSMCDITINCSIKEGLALTAYESLSMGVPIVSANVGGHKELINDKCGIIVPLLQKEEEINDYDYKEEEILNYVNAIEKITKNLKKYTENCRGVIINKFSLKNMISEMQKNIDDVINNQSETCIKNAQSLKANKNIIYEYINHYFMGSEYEFKTQINRYYASFETIEKITPKEKKIISFIKKIHIYNEYLLVKELIISIFKIILFPIKLILIEIKRILNRKGE